MEKVCTIGLGYIGLPTASLMATKGFQVHGIDINPEAVQSIQQGKVHIYEPDLDVLVKAAVQSGNLTASMEPQKADIFILAVPTPFIGNHKPDLSYVEKATRSIAPYLEQGNLVILESTSPVGTTEKVAQWLQEERPDLIVPARSIKKSMKKQNQIYIAHCPERVLPGQILKELVTNDRIIGGIDQESAEKAKLLYKKFVSGNVLVTDCRTAEMAKLTENSFRDVNIAFANELSIVCETMDINVWELIELANRHPRVNILQPGPGVGGHCIAVDPWFIVDSAPESSRLIRTAREVNDFKPHFISEKVKVKANRFKNPVIACLGLAFKADIDDLRESPAVTITKELAANENLTLLAVEPHVNRLPDALQGKQNLELVDLDYALEKADIILLLVNHRFFADVSKDLLREKVVIDTRGMWR
ncbi:MULTISPECIES: UDP-N-acetyl-D-mannosamine dehydrogenase [Pelosinus]|uniref:Nucleotide sugar dehydrogenase n=1 Tax=Pelosinus fermentans B4 TaxID=1149862 RepID=I9L707_9FIRM|nr:MULTISPECIES: UDP-N-acetyl-D-mannosamine dehydrogenase [Pelosinus]EIW16026.1 nucleotide sugar dehydrogenase [Pelosinus fermentans B4]EIW27268.1 nucleotide sugar dehydrogenase [Pelosinus fermentans A11]